MDTVYLLNGFSSHLLARDDTMFEAISKHWNLPVEDVKKVAIQSVEAMNRKVIKPQKRTAQNKAFKRTVSGYQYFCFTNRDNISALLTNNESSRTFVDGKGQTVVLGKDDFKDGQPTFPALTKKIAASWRSLTQSERDEYNCKAKTLPSLVQ